MNAVSNRLSKMLPYSFRFSIFKKVNVLKPTITHNIIAIIFNLRLQLTITWFPNKGYDYYLI